jgi:hypothetical protein
VAIPKGSELPIDLPVIPRQFDLSGRNAAAARCKACDLWKRGTQTVLGEGSAHAQLMLVGEQPGTAKTSKAGLLWGQLEAFSIRLWKKRELTASSFMSRMRSNT